MNVRMVLKFERILSTLNPTPKRVCSPCKLVSTKINRRDGYEVAFFISKLMNKHGVNRVGCVYAIENLLHIKSLIYINNQEILIRKIEEILFLENLF